MIHRKYWFYLLVLIVILNIFWLYGIYHASYKYSASIDEKLTKPCGKRQYEFLKLYPAINECMTPNDNWTWLKPSIDQKLYNYSMPASDYQQKNLRIVRAILIYFPSENYGNYLSEVRWLYRSWVEMMKYEPPKWRTDLVIFMDATKKFKLLLSELERMNCSLRNLRQSKKDRPMCTLVNAPPLKNRSQIGTQVDFMTKNDMYYYFLNQVNVFSNDTKSFEHFFRELKTKLKNYPNLESILVAFEAYSYLKKGHFDFAMKTDIDVFLTPLFAKWLPRYCNDFYAGNGGYSTQFNLRRLKGIAKDLNLQHASVMNFGSTWFGTPDQFRIVSYLALFSMLYISEEEFSPTEQEGKLGTMHWPYWHYGVLSMYGSDLAINHFRATQEFNVVKLEDLLDFPTANNYSIFSKIQLHVFHGDDLFSKFKFKEGFYDKINISEQDSTLIKYYALKMALESKNAKPEELAGSLAEQVRLKT